MENMTEMRMEPAGRKDKGRMRLPAGFGSVRYLGSRRRNPFAVHPPQEPGQVGHPKALCYVPDWFTGFAVLVAYHSGLYYEGIERKLADAVMFGGARSDRKVASKPTLLEVYRRFCEWKFGQDAPKKLSESARRAAESGIRRLKPFHNVALDDIPIDELQRLVNGIGYSRTTVKRVVILIRQLYRYALPRGLCTRDQGAAIVMPDTPPERHHQEFTDEELKILWDYRRDPIVRMVLIMCYSGFRVSEWLSLETDLKTNCFRGGIKTKAGKNRTVPIHSAIQPLVEETLRQGEYLCGKSITRFCHIMSEKMEEIGIDREGRHHTTHSCRHTFSRLCETYGVREADRKRMLGHSFAGDITNGVYGHRTPEELRAEIEKIQV